MRLLIIVLAGLALTTVVTQAKEAAESNLLAPTDCAKFTRMPDGTIHVGENVTISGVTYKGADLRWRANKINGVDPYDVVMQSCFSGKTN
jgi:hypothetical protein